MTPIPKFILKKCSRPIRYFKFKAISLEIPHPTSSLDRNLSKNTGRYVEDTNKKSSFFYDTYPQIYIKKVFKTYTVFQI